MKRNHRIGKIWIIFLISLIIIYFSGCGKKKEEVADRKKAAVKLSVLKEGEFKKFFSFTGTIKSQRKAELLSKISGRVESVPVEEGDYVHRGEVVVQLENDDWLAQLNQARAALGSAQAQVNLARSGYSMTKSTTNTQVDVAKQAIDQAKEGLEQARVSLKDVELDFNRTKNLYDRGAVSRQSLDKAQTQFDLAKSRFDSAQSQLRQIRENYNLAVANTTSQDIKKDEVATAMAGLAQAEANVKYAEVMLNYTTIRSPIDGVITQRNTEPGQIVAPGDKIFPIVVTDNSTVYIESEVPETEAMGMKLNDPVKVTVESLPGKEFTGRIMTIIPSADPQSRAFRIKVAIKNPGNILKNGMSAVAAAQTATYKGIVIPRHWLIQIEGEFYISLVSDQTTTDMSKIQPAEITNWSAFLKDLKKHDSPASARLWNMMDNKAKKIIESKDLDKIVDGEVKKNFIQGIIGMFKPNPEVTSEDRMEILASLNRILSEKDFYNQESFKNVKLSPEADRIMKKGLNGLKTDEIIRLNRLLVEGIFPKLLAKSQTVSQRKVLIGAINENEALITEGVKVGQEVISTGQESLKDGDPIEIKGYDDEKGKKAASRVPQQAKTNPGEPEKPVLSSTPAESPEAPDSLEPESNEQDPGGNSNARESGQDSNSSERNGEAGETR